MNSKSKENKLIRACKRCDFKLVQELLSNRILNSKSVQNIDDVQKNQTVNSQKYADINCRESKFQMTPLMIASLRGSRDIVLYLINHGANVTLRDVKGNTALQLACMKQRFHVVDALLQNKANPNDVNMSGWNCLISAVNYFHEDSATMLLLLLQTGAKTEHKDNNGLICIDHAVRKNKINAIRIILNFNQKLTQYCVRALVNASIKGYFDIVLLLLNYGVSPNKIDTITGTGPLHEAVRYNEIKDEKSRFERLKIVKFLALYGADPELPNIKRETPMKLAVIKPQGIAEQYIESMKVFYNAPHIKPKFLNFNNGSLKETIIIPCYPLLKPQPNWIKNDYRFCSSYSNKINKDPVTNLIDGNPNSLWTATGKSLNWVVFDLKAEHVITKIRIYCWKSKEMPAECVLQVSNSLEGPWNNVQTFKCEMIGSSLRNGAGVPMDFDGFYAIARYWRLVMANNYGAKDTSFHGVEFFGYDYRISKLIDQLKLNEYENILIENDLNQIEAIFNCTFDQFNRLPIENKNDREKLWNFFLEFQKKVQPLKKLDWFNEPVPYGLVGQNFPAFSVTSTAFLTDALQLNIHGGGIINGETCIDMEPGGMNDPSMAIFRNISISNPGKFILEIKSINNNDISIASQPIQIFELGDPEYEKLIGKNPNFQTNSLTKSKMNNQNGEGDSDDETLEQIYNFAEFNDNTSKMKINKWLSKSQDNDLNGYEPDYNNTINNNPNSYNNNNVNLRYPHVNQINFNNTNGNGNNHSPRYQNEVYNYINNNENMSPRSPRLTRYDDSIRNSNLNGNINGKTEIYYDPSVNMPTSKSKRPAPIAPEIDPNHYYNNSHTFSIKNPDFESEYEIQTFSIDLLDEMSISSKDYKFFELIDRVEPKTEARVYVNNPDTIPPVKKQTTSLSYPSPPFLSETNNQLRYSKMNSSQKKSNQVNPSTSISKTPIITEQSKSDNPKSNVINIEQKKNGSILKNSNTDTSFIRHNKNNSSMIKNKPANNSLSSQVEQSKRSTSTPRFSMSTNNSKSVAPPPPPPLLPISQMSSIPNAPSFPPPPPPPPQLEPTGLLKFAKKTKSSDENRKMSSLQEELELKLFKVRKSLSDDNENRSSINYKEDSALIVDNVNNIHRFDPKLLKSELKKNGYNSDINEISNVNDYGDSNGLNGNEYEFSLNPRETFTSKAKKALENYKNTKSSDSSIDGINVRIKSTSSKSKYPQLPSFTSNEQNGHKFVD